MRINEIYLENFRNVRSQSYRLHEHFTVIIGINGKGKSTWLHALRIACGTYFLGISEVSSRHIIPDEVRRIYGDKMLLDALPVVVQAKGHFPELPGETLWRRRVLSSGAKTTFSNEDVGIVRDLGKSKYEKIKNGAKLDLPVVAFFGTSRAHGAGRNRQPRAGREIFKEGYHSWYEMRSTTYRYDVWLGNYDALLKQGQEYPGSREFFMETILKANPYIEQLVWDSYLGEFRMRVRMSKDEPPGDMLPLHLHSDGMIQFTEMVAELAFRCIVLNAHKGERSITDTCGIVLIDELDLHLHPLWQRHVVADLQNAFPNIQFVATTHSPFIVQSLDAGQLINLDLPDDAQPNRLHLHEVSQLMGVPTPYSQENYKQEQLSEEYLHLLENKDPKHEDFDSIESQISDPASRAFLQMQRLKKRIKKR